ncbi:MAG: UvrD-helicase domain-containing protein [Clostridiales bacterium]|jgi:DNA helicase-2/ATP-dependent DNA helicase PcrA|nr:UvrD-helicase domain-containing protein [Clostridiales bacterium]
MDLLDNLNPEQQKPALHTEGAVMVSAGAGSGKTRVLTYRIAHLILSERVAPWNILAITFTNKAAREMRERLEKLLDESGSDVSGMWVMTFHAMCARLLRYHGDEIGYTRNFSIYAEDDSARVLKNILKEGGESDKDEALRKKIRFHIGNRKSNALTLDDYLAQNYHVAGMKQIGAAMEKYDVILQKNNAMDFDDLLYKAFELLTQKPEILERYRQKFKYIHIDEFQDTNLLQYMLVKLLAGGYGNVMAVGDEDQSIYGWRGARFSNIGDFVRDFHASVYKLEQNYRSTQRILNAANSVIKNNASRIDKTLWTNNGEGAELAYFEARDEGAEAESVARKIREASGGDKPLYRRMAVLTRINALSRAFEEKFLLYGIPYRVYGGFKFYERKEIKDVLAFARAAVNHEDDEAVLRAAGVGGRGIGQVTLDTLTRYGAVVNLSLYRILETVERNEEFKPTVVKKLAPFAAVLKQAAEYAATQPPDVALFNIIRASGLNDLYAEENDENLSRRMNIDELIASVQEFAKANADASLSDFLQSAQLLTDMDANEDGGGVTLATIHAAKGLEFDYVFIAGMEEGIFPVSRAADNPSDLEEERRLLYVALTRARKELTLTRAESRFMYGTRMPSLPSRFLPEIEGIDARPARRESRGFADGFGVNYRRNGNTFTGNGERVPDNRWNKEPDDYGESGGGGGRRRFGSWDEERGEERETAPKAPRYAPTPVLRAADIAPRDFSAFRAGMAVEHPKFGRGEILSLNGGLAEIRFAAAGKKTLSLAFAPLTVIES